MERFGTIKTKVLKQLTEAYIKKNKKQISSIIKLIKEDKSFLEIYKLYDIVEEKYFDDKEVAKLYVEEISKLLNGKESSLNHTCKKFDSVLTEAINENNKLYDALDHLLGSDNIINIDKKIIAKKEIVSYLTTNKPEVELTKVENFTVNETLLSTILTNNFNSKYEDILDEEDKKELKEIMDLSYTELNEKINEVKASIDEKISVLEEQDKTNTITEKLNAVRNRINEMDSSRLSYYKMKQLEKDL